MKIKLLLLLIAPLILFSCSKQNKQNEYLGQKIPLGKPKIFAPGIVSVDSTSESIISATNDGLALYFPRYFKDRNGKINRVLSLYTRFDGTKWTELKSIDREIFYKTPRFVNDTLAIMNYGICLWKSIKVNDSVWTKPVFFDSLNLSKSNGVTDWTITSDLTIFYVKNGNIKTAKLYNNDNANDISIEGFSGFTTQHVTVSPKGDYLVCAGYIEGVNNGEVDIFISFNISENKWTYPVHLDKTINAKNQTNFFPRISPDGEVLFFSRLNETNYGDIYWMSTKELVKYKSNK